MKSKRVLIVEDENDVRDVIVEIVALLGYESCCYSDAESALVELGRSSFDLVITDLGLPKMDGVEFMREIRLNDIETPVLVIAGVDLSRSDIDFRRMKNWGFVQKPFTLDSITRRMAELLQESNKNPSRRKLNKGHN